MILIMGVQWHCMNWKCKYIERHGVKMKYIKLSEENINEIVNAYIDYYNNCEGGCWTYEKAYKRIHQVMTIEDAECFVQYVDGELSGFVMGYYKEFDDLKAYFLEEIVVFGEFQNKGYGAALMEELERVLRKNSVAMMELSSVKDEHHMHFYKKLGFYVASNFVAMGKFLVEM